MGENQKLQALRCEWERTLLHVTFDEATPVLPTDTFKLVATVPVVDVAGNKVKEVALTESFFESSNKWRFRFLLGYEGGPVPAGAYKLVCMRDGQAMQVVATAEAVKHARPWQPSTDMMLFPTIGSYYSVLPDLMGDSLGFKVEARGIPVVMRTRPLTTLKNGVKNLIKNGVAALSVGMFRLFKKLPTDEKKVMFISDSRTEMSGNMKYVRDRMVARGMDDYKFAYSFKDHVGPGGGRGLSYIPMMYNLATSKTIFCDDFVGVLYQLKFHKGVRVVQVWHACGAFKAVGMGRMCTPMAASPFTVNHRTYTHVTVASDRDVPIYAEAFGIPESHICVTGIPRHDELLDPAWQERKRAAFAEKFPKAAGKKVLVFAPTFRGTGSIDATYDFSGIDFEALAQVCREKNIYCYMKMHPYVKEKAPLPANTDDVFGDGSAMREVNDILPSTDLLITDYSSVVYEAALFNIPTLYYAYDLDKYLAERNIYGTYEDFVSGSIAYSFDELLQNLRDENYGVELLEKFKKTNFRYIDTHACDRIIDEIVLGD